MTYNGDEIGMLDYREIPWDETLDPQACNTNNPNDFKWASRDPVRTPYQWDGTAYAGFKEAIGSPPWIQVHPNYRELNLELQKAAPKSFYKLYKQLSQFRNDPVFVNGLFESHAFNGDVFAFKRSFEGKTYVILLNFASNEHTVNVNALNAGFPAQCEVALAGSRASYNAG